MKMGEVEDVEEMEINAYYWGEGMLNRSFQGKFSVKSMIIFVFLRYS